MNSYQIHFNDDTYPSKRFWIVCDEEWGIALLNNYWSSRGVVRKLEEYELDLIGIDTYNEKEVKYTPNKDYWLKLKQEYLFSKKFKGIIHG